MHGLGNDFVVIDGVRQSVRLSTEHVRQLSNRRFGVGFDQLLLLERSSDPTADFRYRVFNADGTEVEHCGNGARCVALFLRREGLSATPIVKLRTATGTIRTRIEEDRQVTVEMGIPAFDPAAIPLLASAPAEVYKLDVAGTSVAISALAIGNPHAVCFVPRVEAAPVATLGPSIESHPLFPRRVNVGFAEVVDGHHVRLRVYERGAGETLACGSGACAAVVAGRTRGLLHEPVQVDLPGGRLMVSWKGRGEPVFLTGPGVFVFEGILPT